MPALAYSEVVERTSGVEDDYRLTIDRLIASPPETKVRSLESPFLPVASLTATDLEKTRGAAVDALLQPFSAPSAPPFKLLQQWEGIVSTKPSKGEFAAVLRDRTNPSLPEEQATFWMEQVSTPDHRLVVPGAVFYWSIGYEETRTGTRRTISFVRFRRLPAWSRGDMRRIERDVERFKRLFQNAG